MRELIKKLEEGKSYDSMVSIINGKIKSAIDDLKKAKDGSESADSVVFNTAVALSSLAGVISAVSQGHGGKLSRIVGLINGAASDLSTKGRKIVKEK